MKKYLLFILVLAQYSFGCPGCVGRIEKGDPEYFSNDFYKAKPEHEKKLSDNNLRRWAQEEENQEIVDEMANPEMP